MLTEEEKQQLFPWMSQDEPLDKNIGRYKSFDNYLRAKTRGGRKTEDAAKQVVSASPNNWVSGKEEVEKIFNSEIVIPPSQFSNGQIRSEKHIAFVLLRKLDPFANGSHRLLAFWQGDRTPLTKQGILSDLHPVIGGIVFRGEYLTHAWVSPDYKSLDLYRRLREFARKYLGVIGVAPADELTSKSYRAAQAKYDWKRYQQTKNPSV